MSFFLPVLAATTFNCPVLVVPANADDKWNVAAHQAAEQISHLTNTERDCSVIVVEVLEQGAQLTMTTTDGRRATRPIRNPDEIFPVIRALVVTVPPTTKEAETPSVSPTENPSDKAVAPDSAGGSAQSTRDANKFVWGLFLTVAGGARLANASAGLSPLAEVSVGALLGHFETGVTGSREFGYLPTSAMSPDGTGFSATSISANSIEVFAGVRQPLGPVALIAGIRGGASFVSEQAKSTQICPDQAQCIGNDTYDTSLTRHVTEQRLGVYFASAVPLKYRFRLRPQLDFTFVTARFRDTTVPKVDAYALPTAALPIPGWGVALSLGLEASVL